MRPGARLAVDVGSVRVGVAVSDPEGILATPLDTVARSAGGEVSAVDEDVLVIAGLVQEYAVTEVTVGWPLTLTGEEGTSARFARRYAGVLAEVVHPVSVRLLDERFTSTDAHRALRESGVDGRRQRAVVDQAAAVLILQAALDAERRSGHPPGRGVQDRPRRKPRLKGPLT